MNTQDNKTISGIDRNMSEANRMTEEQAARYVADLLNDHAQHLTAATIQRLSVARSQAVSQLASRQAQTIHHSGHVLQWLGHNVGQYFSHHRAMSVAVVAAAMLLAFFAAQQFGFKNNLENSDAFLLASDLPPEAYADKGFDTWLVSKRD